LLTKNRRYNRLEVYTYAFPATETDDDVGSGLNFISSTRIFGRITILSKFRPNDSSVDHVFVGTDQCQFFTLSWDASSRRLRTEKPAIDLADKAAREVQSGERCQVDPSNEYMTVEAYEGIITVIPVADRKKGVGKARAQVQYGVMGQPIHTRIPEFFVQSSAFIQRKPLAKPRLALLWRGHDEVARLRIRELNVTGDNSVEFSDLKQAGDVESLDIGASHLIPVQEDPYGLLVVGETSISYFEDESCCIQVQKPLAKATVWAAWVRIDNERYVLADDYGTLYLLCLIIKAETVVSWKLDELGTTSRASSLVYLENGALFVGSHHGDSQVVRIRPEGLLVAGTIPNIAPILDFTVMDMGNRSTEGPGNDFSTGQARIVTGSGSWQDGSLRSVRSGVGLEELGVLEDMAHATNVFALRMDLNLPKDDALLISFVNESRLFSFEPDGEVREEQSVNGLELAGQTLLATNVSNDNLLQVTKSLVALIDLDSGMKESWSPDRGVITSVSATKDSVAVSVDGKQLIIFGLQRNLPVRSKAIFQEQLSCVALSPLFPNCCFAGSWSRSVITIFDAGSLRPLKEIRVSEGDLVVPQSIVLTKPSPDKDATVTVAMADGHVITFDLDCRTLEEGPKTSTILGTRQPDLQPIPFQDGATGVFVASEHPSLIYMDEGRMTYSAVNTGPVNCVCPFDSVMYPNAVIVASPKDIKIAHIDSERTTQVQPLQLGETTRRIAYSPSLKAFGIGSIKREIQDGAEILESNFKLADEVVFKVLDTYPLRKDELIEAVIRTELDEGPETAERFIVGTSYLDDHETGDFRGRIIVFEVTEDRKLKVVTQISTKGACRCLAMVEGHLAAALVKNVVVYSLDQKANGSLSLQKRATYRTSTFPIAMVVNGNEIAVADMMKSLSVLVYTPRESGSDGKDSLVEVARHYQLLWATAVTQVEKDTWLEADAEGNLVVLTRNREGVTEDDRRHLQVVSEIRLGELVNAMQTIEVKASPTSIVIPKAFLATVRSPYIRVLLMPSRERDRCISSRSFPNSTRTCS
jgi:DNA damage-binding protein 1